MFTATSISPFWSAATRTASSGIGRKTTVLILGSPAPVAGNGLQHDLLVLRPAHELVGAGADRVLREMAAVSLPAYSFGGYMAACAEAEGGHEDRPRLLGVDAHRVGIDDLDAVDGREEGGCPGACWPDSPARSRLNFTDSALNSSPLWNFTPLRSLTSHAVGATSFGISVASAGTILRFWSRSTSVSKICAPTFDAGLSCWFAMSRRGGIDALGDDDLAGGRRARRHRQQQDGQDAP